MIINNNNFQHDCGWRAHLFAFLFFLLIAFVLVYPVLCTSDVAICSDDAPDAWIHIWTFWRARYAMLGYDHAYFLSHTLTFPGLVHIPVAVFDPLLSLMSFPLYALFGSYAVVYNLLVFSGLLFSGICGYILGLVFTKRRSAGLIAGVIIAANPFTYRLIAGGYIEYAWWGLLPLTVSLYYLCIKTPSKLNITGYVLSLTSLLLMLIYCASYFVLISCISLLFAVVSFFCGRRDYLINLIKVQSIALCCLLPLLLFWIHCLGSMEWKNVEWPHRFPVEKIRRYAECDLSLKPGIGEEPEFAESDDDYNLKSLEEMTAEWMAWRVLIGSLDLAELLNPGQSWLKKYPSRNMVNDECEQLEEPVFFFDESAFFCESMLILFLCLFAFRIKSKRKENALYAGCACFFLVLTLGPYLIWNGSVVSFVKLPYLWMYELIPGFCRFFIPGRAFLGVVLFSAILTARGIEVLGDLLCGRCHSKIIHTLNISLPLLIFASFSFFGYGKLSLPSTDVIVPKIFKTIGNQPGEFAILNMPLEGDISRRLLHQTFHDKPVYGGEFATEWATPTGTKNVDTNTLVLALQCYLPESVEKKILRSSANSLHKLGFRFIILHRGGYVKANEYDMANSILGELLGTPFYMDHEINIYQLSADNNLKSELYR